MAGLILPQGEAVAAESEFDGIAEGRPADELDGGAVAEAHLEEPAAEFGIAADVDDFALAAVGEVMQGASGDWAGVVTVGFVAGLVHDGGSEIAVPWVRRRRTIQPLLSTFDSLHR